MSAELSGASLMDRQLNTCTTTVLLVQSVTQVEWDYGQEVHE